MYPFLKEWLDKKRYVDVWLLARYFYRIGEPPLISDALYDKITNIFKSHNVEALNVYLNRTYDDDPIPVKLLQEIGVEPIHIKSAQARYELYPQLNEEKSLSIESVVSYEEAFNFFRTFRELQKDLVLSIKMDGVNTRLFYVNGELGISVSRGRSGNGFDFTEQIANVVPTKIDAPGELKMTGESFVLESGIRYLRARYDKDKYKTAKSSAISVLRTKHDKETYRHLKTIMFAAEGLADTLAGTYQKLEELGFDVVPYMKVCWSEIPSDIDLFKEWLHTLFRGLYEKQMELGLPADGVVAAVDDLLWADVVTNQYSNRQIACKFDYWKFDVYKAVVTDIVMEQRRVNVSCRVKIEPRFTSDDCEAKIINIFNPGILIENNIKKGSEVFFERNSGAVNILIHGQRFKDIVGE